MIMVKVSKSLVPTDVHLHMQLSEAPNSLKIDTSPRMWKVM